MTPVASVSAPSTNQRVTPPVSVILLLRRGELDAAVSVLVKALHSAEELIDGDVLGHRAQLQPLLFFGREPQIEPRRAAALLAPLGARKRRVDVSLRLFRGGNVIDSCLS